jgi:protein SCO1/2
MIRRVLASIALVLLASVPAFAGEPAAATQSPAEHYFTNVELVNQDGQTMRFYDDLLHGRVVVINSFFASCHGSCPVMAANLAALQTRFSDRLGKDLVLISISVDPEDTPEKLKAFAQQFQAKPGWYFITGKRENVMTALRKLGQFVEEKNDHYNIVLIGNDRTGLWKKAFGIGPRQDLINAVQSVLDNRE